jgi:hypothetical protein
MVSLEMILNTVKILTTQKKTLPPRRDKARESRGMSRTHMYVGMTGDETQSREARDRWTFCEVV